jgi:hypothetical protein
MVSVSNFLSPVKLVVCVVLTLFSCRIVVVFFTNRQRAERHHHEFTML